MVEGIIVKWSEVELLKSNVDSGRMKYNHVRVV